MNTEPDRYVYLCAFAHYTGGTLVISNEQRALPRPIAPEDIQVINADLQERGFRQAMVISFSLFTTPAELRYSAGSVLGPTPADPTPSNPIHPEREDESCPNLPEVAVRVDVPET